MGGEESRRSIGPPNPGRLPQREGIRGRRDEGLKSGEEEVTGQHEDPGEEGALVNQEEIL